MYLDHVTRNDVVSRCIRQGVCQTRSIAVAVTNLRFINLLSSSGAETVLICMFSFVRKIK